MISLTFCLSPLLGGWSKSLRYQPFRTALVFLVTNPHPETTYRWQALSHYHTKIHFRFGDSRDFRSCVQKVGTKTKPTAC